MMTSCAEQGAPSVRRRSLILVLLISADYALYSVQHILQRFREMRDHKEFQRILDEATSISGVEEASTDGARKFRDGWRVETVC